jgi:hypothetical protein
MICSFIKCTFQQRSFFIFGIAMLLLFVTAPSMPGQRRAAEEDEKPLFHEYRGIQIGMLADEVRKKLGSPADKSDEQDFYNLSDAESAQIYYDKARKVTAISANFLQGAADIPTPKSLFGADLAAKPDGSVYKMARYPKAGCWLAYSKTAGASPLITITLQKIE